MNVCDVVCYNCISGISSRELVESVCHEYVVVREYIHLLTKVRVESMLSEWVSDKTKRLDVLSLLISFGLEMDVYDWLRDRVLKGNVIVTCDSFVFKSSNGSRSVFQNRLFYLRNVGVDTLYAWRLYSAFAEFIVLIYADTDINTESQVMKKNRIDCVFVLMKRCLMGKSKISVLIALCFIVARWPLVVDVVVQVKELIEFVKGWVISQTDVTMSWCWYLLKCVGYTGGVQRISGEVCEEMIGCLSVEECNDVAEIHVSLAWIDLLCNSRFSESLVGKVGRVSVELLKEWIVSRCYQLRVLKDEQDVRLWEAECKLKRVQESVKECDIIDYCVLYSVYVNVYDKNNLHSILEWLFVDIFLIGKVVVEHIDGFKSVIQHIHDTIEFNLLRELLNVLALLCNVYPHYALTDDYLFYNTHFKRTVDIITITTELNVVMVELVDKLVQVVDVTMQAYMNEDKENQPNSTKKETDEFDSTPIVTNHESLISRIELLCLLLSILNRFDSNANDIVLDMCCAVDLHEIHLFRLVLINVDFIRCIGLDGVDRLIERFNQWNDWIYKCNSTLFIIDWSTSLLSATTYLSKSPLVSQWFDSVIQVLRCRAFGEWRSDCSVIRFVDQLLCVDMDTFVHLIGDECKSFVHALLLIEDATALTLGVELVKRMQSCSVMPLTVEELFELTVTCCDEAVPHVKYVYLEFIISIASSQESLIPSALLIIQSALVQRVSVATIHGLLVEFAKNVNVTDFYLLLESYFPFLIHSWFAQSKQLIEYPWDVHGYTTFEEFCREKSVVIVAESIAVFKGIHIVSELVDVIGQSVQSLLSNSFAVLMSHCIPLYYTGSDGVADDIISVMVEYLGNEGFNVLLSKNVDDIILLLFLSTNSVNTTLNVSVDVVCKSVDHIISVIEQTTHTYLTPLRVYQLLLSILKEMVNGTRHNVKRLFKVCGMFTITHATSQRLVLFECVRWIVKGVDLKSELREWLVVDESMRESVGVYCGRLVDMLNGGEGDVVEEAKRMVNEFKSVKSGRGESEKFKQLCLQISCNSLCKEKLLVGLREMQEWLNRSGGGLREEQFENLKRILMNALVTTHSNECKEIISLVLIHMYTLNEENSSVNVSTELSISTEWILINLDSFLVDADFRIVDCAQKTLYSIFLSKEGQDALEKVPRETHLFLSLFNQNICKSTRSLVGFGSYSDISCRDLWRCLDDKEYEEWIKRIACSTVLSCETDDIVKHMAPMMELNTSFAERLFPLIAYKALYNDRLFQDESERCGSSFGPTTVAFSEGISIAMETSGIRCACIIVDLLEYLRGQTLPNARMLIENTTWLNVNWLKAAYTAFHCNRVYEAIVFCEIYADRLFASRGKGKEESFPLLKQIYSTIDEPDGFYGVMEIGDDDLLSRWEHERDMEKISMLLESKYVMDKGDEGLRGEMVKAWRGRGHLGKCGGGAWDWGEYDKCADWSVVSREAESAVLSLFGDGERQGGGNVLKVLLYFEQFSFFTNRVDDLPSLVKAWDVENVKDKRNVFEILEARANVIKAYKAVTKTENQILDELYVKTLFATATVARKKKLPQIVSNVLVLAKVLSNSIGGLLKEECEYHEAKHLWSLNEQLFAMKKLAGIINRLESAITPFKILSKSLSLMGYWMAQTRFDRPSVIIETLKRGLEQNIGDKDKSDIAFRLAEYAREQYEKLANDDELKNSAEVHKHKRDELEAMNTILLKAKKDDKARYQQQKRRLEIVVEADRLEEERIECEKKGFLYKALSSYLIAIELSEKHRLVVFKIYSLWMANLQDDHVHSIIRNSKVPSYKFIDLIYQLSSRMNLDDSEFQSVLQNLIGRMVYEHPFHTLYQVFALKNSTLGNKNKSDEEQARSKAAHEFLAGLFRKGKLAGIVGSMEKLVNAYNQLAYTSGKYDKAKPIPLDSNWKLTRIRNFELVVPTYNLEINPLGDYSKAPTIESFGTHFRVVGGINLPKIVECRGSDGKNYTQLVKGQDDLRQDAVMQQVFRIVNVLLEKHEATRERKLCIRTYKVLPLSPRSGVLEWVNNTCPLRSYLVPSHKLYHPNDLCPMQCRKIMEAAHAKRTMESNYKTRVFVEEILPKLSPVFRHFFFEKFPQPKDWFQKRLNYSRSVAASSILGWIIGLGDRHCDNILIDTNSAQVIHIDLGIAFDQGKLLPTPEQVPFRLTRDIVDGMGVNGTEGVFKRCCEKTLQVLRKEADIVVAILQVFKYDPLYSWTLSPLKLKRLGEGQEDDTTKRTERNNSNKEAERALMAVKKKLDGGLLSVEFQVNELIQAATSNENLAMMFPGWQSWL